VPVAHHVSLLRLVSNQDSICRRCSFFKYRWHDLLDVNAARIVFSVVNDKAVKHEVLKQRRCCQGQFVRYPALILKFSNSEFR
jgi:hypothetical protein